MSTVTEGKVHVGNSGTEFELEILVTDGAGNNIPKDLSVGGTTAQIIFTNPSADEITVDAVIKSPAAAGKISYTNMDDKFFDDNSFWFYRSKITQSGTVFQSNDASFEVLGSQQ